MSTYGERFERLLRLVTLDDVTAMCSVCGPCDEASAVEQYPTRCERHREIAALLLFAEVTRIK
jgi:hypothetical protein